MKINILQKSAAMCVGVVFVVCAVSARADEPKKDDTATTTTTHKRVATKTAHHARPVVKPATAVAAAPTAPIPTKEGRDAKYVSGGTLGGGNGPEYAVPTGSLIPRAYNRRGYTTDSPFNTFIIDQNDQRFQNSDTVQGVLRQVPGVNVGGTR